MEEQKHGFTGIWIPAEIIEEYDLTANEMFLFGVIHSFSKSKNEKGDRVGCFASNEYLAKILKVQVPTIIKNLANLRQKNLIKTTYFNGRYRIMETTLNQNVRKSQY